MERSGSQKFLKFVSVIAVIFGTLGVLFGAMFIFGGGMIGSSSEAVVEGMTNQEASIASMGVGAVAIISSLFELVSGILGIRAANDNQKIMPVWVFSLIGFLGAVGGLIANVINGTMVGGTASTVITSLIGSGLMLWIANNIKVQAGK